MRNLLFDRSGSHLFLTVGSETGQSPKEPPRATILRLYVDGSKRTVEAGHRIWHVGDAR